MTERLDLTPTQALGVALSVQAGTMEMGEAQERAPAMLEHLRAMGFDVIAQGVRVGDDRWPHDRNVQPIVGLVPDEPEDAGGLRAALGRFLRRTGGLTVRFEDGRGYVRVPSEWVDDLAALAAQPAPPASPPPLSPPNLSLIGTAEKANDA